jgi:hypothetical protein
MDEHIQAEQKQVELRARSRTITQRPVTFRCAWCGQIVTELRFPGPTPRYGTACKAEATRYAEALKKARQRHAPRPARRRTATCWDSPSNLLTYGYIDPRAHGVADELQRIRAALDARRIDRADEHIRRFLEECGL